MELYDYYKSIDTTGLNAGRIQYEVLIRETPKDKIDWLTLNEIGKKIGQAHNSNQSNGSFVQAQLNELKEIFYQDKINQYLSIVTINNKGYFLRQKNKFISNIKLKDMIDSNIADIILDEAYSLGLTHGRALRYRHLKTKEYVAEWERISDADIDKISHETLDKINKVFKQSN